MVETNLPVIILKDVYKSSFREISRELEIGREKIRNIYKK